FTVFFCSSRAHRRLYSFPTRRSSDLCSPCNPTGAVYTHAEIKAIAQWARDRKVWVIADEIYRRIHYGTGPAPSFLDLPDELLERDRKSTRLNSSHDQISYAVFCLKKK